MVMGVIGVRVATDGLSVRGACDGWSCWFLRSGLRFLFGRQRRCGRWDVNGLLWIKLAEGVAGRLFWNHWRRGGWSDSRMVWKMSILIVGAIKSRMIKWSDWVLRTLGLFWWRGWRRQWAGRERSRCLGHWCCSGCRVVRHLKVILRVIRTRLRYGCLGRWRGSSCSFCSCWCHCRVVERCIGVIHSRWILTNREFRNLL